MRSFITTIIFTITTILILPTANSFSASRGPESECTNAESTRTITREAKDFIYPDSVKGDPNVNCIHGLCSNVADYPKENIQQLLKSSNFSNYFDVPTDLNVTVVNRFNNDDEEEMSLCEVARQTLYPETAMNLKNESRIIVNVEGHKQAIVAETCATKMGKCKYTESFPMGYTTFCQQKYTIRRMVVFSAEKNLAYDSFEVPSCCVCMVKRS